MKKKITKILSTLMIIGSTMFNVAFASPVIDINDYETVIATQTQLCMLGYGISVDGVWGDETAGAVAGFQDAHDLEITGEVDRTTKEYMDREQPEVSRGQRTMVVEATGYSRYDAGCGDYTASGTYLRRGIIAVDPDVIPMGTRVYIPNYGMAVAEDTGGAIVGNRIDLAFDSHQEAINWGRRNVAIVIIG